MNFSFLTAQYTGCRKWLPLSNVQSIIAFPSSNIIFIFTMFFYLVLGLLVRVFFRTTYNLTHLQISYCVKFHILHMKECIFHISNTTPCYVFCRTLTGHYFKWRKYVYLGQFSIIFLYLESSVACANFT